MKGGLWRVGIINRTQLFLRLQISLLENPSGVVNVAAVRGWRMTSCDAIPSIYSTCIPFALHLDCPATRVNCGSNEGCINQRQGLLLPWQHGPGVVWNENIMTWEPTREVTMVPRLRHVWLNERGSTAGWVKGFSSLSSGSGQMWSPLSLIFSEWGGPCPRE
jgi:hypothetical protein